MHEVAIIDLTMISESISVPVGSSYRLMIGATSNRRLLGPSATGSNRACQKQAKAAGRWRERRGLSIASKIPRARKSASSEAHTRSTFSPRFAQLAFGGGAKGFN